MGSVNKVILVGNLGTAPELKYTQSNRPVCNLSIATNEVWKSKDGQKQERVEWHRVTVWGDQAENCEKFLAKGRSVYIEGKLQTQTYEKNGEKRYSTVIVAERVVFLGSGEGQGAGQHREERASGGKRGWGEQQSDGGNGAIPSEPADPSDSIPF